MRTRQTLTEQFSTFLQLEGDAFSGWMVDARLRRSIERCLQESRAQKTVQSPPSEAFWALYWHKEWKAQPNPLATGHLSAYLQEACYWAVRNTLNRLENRQSGLADGFQMAIAAVPKILKACDPDQRSSLKTYSRVAFGNILRDALRQRQEIDFCNDWALLLKVSRKRLVEALTHAGLGADTIAAYVLAWKCFESSYLATKPAKGGPLQRPNEETWMAIAQLYNSHRQTQLTAPGGECSPATLEKWLLECAKRARTYLYPQIASLNAARLGQESGELQDDLPDATHESLLQDLIVQEENRARQLQRSQINAVLTEALQSLDAQSAELMRLYYQQGLPQREIAQQLNTQQYTVSRRLTKARETLLLKFTRWGQAELHISPTSDVVSSISSILEEWLQTHYGNLRNGN